MRGLFKRKGSDLWQGRFRVGSDLWKERQRLADLGVRDVPKTQEHGRSTGKADRSEAGEAYRAMLVAWDAKLAAWRKLLEEGPQALSEKQRVAIAADHARAFLAAHEENPSRAPLPSPMPEPPEVSDAALRAAIRAIPVEARARLATDLQAFLRETNEGRRLRLAIRTIQDHPAFAAFLAPDLATMLEAAHGAETDAALASRGLHVGPMDRQLVNFEMARLMGAAHRGLAAMRTGEWESVRELEVAPRFVATPKSAAEAPDARFTFQGVVDAEKARRALGRDAKPFPESSVRKYSKRGEEFVAWRVSRGLGDAAASDARTVTREEAEQWRASLLADGALTNRTINDKLACISTIIKWGRAQHRAAFHPEGNPLAGLEKLDFRVLDSDARTYRIEEAITVLEAARRETEARRRWLPWVCAYTGMRIEEAGQLEAEDFAQVGGRWFLRVSTSGRRSLKTASSQRRIPIHPSLEAEGFLEFVQAAGKGRLFRGNRSQQLISEWVREVAGVTRPELSPSHGWRHFFEDLCILANVTDAARDYMTGRASGKSRDQYGKSEIMLPGLAEAMDKVPDILALGEMRG
jgi:integrase